MKVFLLIFFDNLVFLSVIMCLEKCYCCLEIYYNVFWINNVYISLLKVLKLKV